MTGAARFGHLAVVERLLQNGGDTSLKLYGVEALRMAEDHGHMDIVDLLVKAGVRLPASW